MTDKEFRRLSRAELVDILYELQKQNDELTAENKKLREDMTQKTIRLTKAGSIAEASIEINEVMQAAQKAADQYLASIQKIDAEKQKQLQDLKIQATQVLSQADKKADEIIANANKQADKIINDAQIQAASRWVQFKRKVMNYVNTNSELQPYIERVQIDER